MGFAIRGMIFVCMDAGVAAAYVVLVIQGIMFVCMDVEVAAYAPSKSSPM